MNTFSYSLLFLIYFLFISYCSNFGDYGGSVSALSLLRTKALPSFTQIGFKTYPISVTAFKPLYFELVMPPNDTTYHGFSISIMCDGDGGCTPAVTTLNVSTDPTMIADGSSMWNSNGTSAYPGITITSFSTPPFKQGVNYYIAYLSSIDIPHASIVCQGFKSNKVLVSPKEMLHVQQISHQKILVPSSSTFGKNSKNHIITKYSAMVPLAHTLDGVSEHQELVTAIRIQQNGFDLFKKGFSFTKAGNFDFHRKVIHPQFYYSTTLKKYQYRTCTEYIYKIYRYDHTQSEKLFPTSTHQSTDSLRQFFMKHADQMSLIFSSLAENSENFCKQIDDMPFGVADFTISHEFFDTKPIALILTVSSRENDHIEYVHYPVLLNLSDDRTFLSRVSTYVSNVLTTIFDPKRWIRNI
ncbi:hypothetical protein FDP41_010933 [Naegleria fowleri]|uniref:Uncharacterized protein n=1 Tax=Naegleria fowleri TaxID=5763 RepID=A0A6A5C8V8_NAEFO|nr:uncharacterized protein FDP41_010933 [Naegleria fowleri]KAF0982954.1 hypothetical protein FDP41_010933 [Naegleria fowleri]CAG4708819.1 unnamed protein product [Naegleria fowleri]